MRVAGKIEEVKGGHIARSNNNNSYQRHKVCTAKGPRDRRFRLSALTAIKFFDVQDRLGYDRPSKAVDWLMKNAKASIDELAEASQKNMKRRIPATEDTVSDPFSTSFLPPSLGSDAIADTIRSFFPVAHRDLRHSLRSFGDRMFQQNPADSGDLPLAGGYELGHCQRCAQRRTIESSDSISVCPWTEPMEVQMHPTDSSIGSSGFQIPAMIQGVEEREGGPSSSRH